MLAEYQVPIIDRIISTLIKRAKIGAEKYGRDRFQGDVVKHIIEEASDTNFYAGQLDLEYGREAGYLRGITQVRSTVSIPSNIYTDDLANAWALLEDKLNIQGLTMTKMVLGPKVSNNG